MVRIGRENGFEGRVDRWSGMLARRELARLRAMAKTAPLRVDGGEGDVHTEAIAKVLNGEWEMEGEKEGKQQEEEDYIVAIS